MYKGQFPQVAEKWLRMIHDKREPEYGLVTDYKPYMINSQPRNIASDAEGGVLGCDRNSNQR